jgi:L-lactate utilization protein LutB
MEQNIDKLFKIWQKRNILGMYCRAREEAADKILELVPTTASVGFSGSVTLNDMGIIKRLEDRGSRVFSTKPGLSREESLVIRRQATEADVYLASANAISGNGELVFFSAYGNRTAGISYAKQSIVVCGINKITPTLDEAIKRCREYATPLNCKRLNWNSPCFADGICRESICLLPEYKRMCCQILIIEAEVDPGRLTVILVGESLGF